MLPLFFAAAWADDGPSPRLWAEVSGHAATVTVGLYQGGEPGVEASYTLVQRGADGAVAATLLADHTFADDPPVGSTGLCHYDEGPDTGIDCTTSPELCYDCDLDGTPECTSRTGFCIGGQLYEVEDPCVEPGDWTWELREVGNDYGWQAGGTVPDDGQACGDDTGTGDDGSLLAGPGCGCGGAGAANAGLGVVMLAVGLASRPARRAAR